jgi:hypothetical protein
MKIVIINLNAVISVNKSSENHAQEITDITWSECEKITTNSDQLSQRQFPCSTDFESCNLVLLIFYSAKVSLYVFARLNTGIVGSNPARGMDVCMRLFGVCVVLCR